MTAREGCFRFQMEQVSAVNQPGAVLAVQVVATNVTDSPCAGRHCGGITGSFEVADHAGRVIAERSPVGVACMAQPPQPTQVAPGGSETWESFAWDGLGPWIGRCVPGDCRPTRSLVGPGSYRVTWRWLDHLTVRSAWITTER
jgi:hypothetical protein